MPLFNNSVGQAIAFVVGGIDNRTVKRLTMSCLMMSWSYRRQPAQELPPKHYLI